MHTFAFDVHSYEADPSGRLTLTGLCAFLQEAAWRNAERMGAGVGRLAEQGLAWVLHRLQVEVQAYPRLGDGLSVTTWAKRFDRVAALRDFEVHHEGRGRVAVATSRWVVVDLHARRVARLPEFIRQLPVPAWPPALQIGEEDLPAVGRAEVERRFDVRRRDLDAARHVNNTCYVEWALEAIPEPSFEACRPTRFEIVFRRESVYGDSVLSCSRRLSGAGGGEFVHGLTRIGDGQELARAVSRWEPVSTFTAGDRA